MLMQVPDHFLRLHLHCPFQYPSLLCPQPGIRCLPSVLLPASCVLVALALPVSFSNRKKEKDGKFGKQWKQNRLQKYILTSKLFNSWELNTCNSFSLVFAEVACTLTNQITLRRLAKEECSLISMRLLEADSREGLTTQFQCYQANETSSLFL